MHFKALAFSFVATAAALPVNVQYREEYHYLEAQALTSAQLILDINALATLSISLKATVGLFSVLSGSTLTPDQYAPALTGFQGILTSVQVCFLVIV